MTPPLLPAGLAPDVAKGKRFLVSHPPPGALVQCGITGAHFYERFHDHYRGFFGGMRREHEREPRLKSVLYSYRVALTGIHLLRTGECVGDVRKLAPFHGFPRILDAVARALESSPLPEEPANRETAQRWLVRVRLAAR